MNGPVRRRVTTNRRLGVATVVAWAVLVVLVAGCNKTPTSPTAPERNLQSLSALTMGCPASISLSALVGALTPVNFPLPAPDNNLIPAAITCSPASGSLFPIGVTPVSCTAAEGDKRAAACSFTVTIVPIVPAPVPVLAVVDFLAFGDSITWGVVSPRGFGAFDVPGSYPWELRQMLQSRYPAQAAQIQVRNEGFPGEAVVDGIGRFMTLIIANPPKAVLLLDGANDLLALQEAAIPAVIDALRQMVRFARARGVQVLLANHPPARAGAQRGHAAAAIPVLNVQIAALAVAEGATLVDLFGGFGPDTSATIGVDGLHPTEEGYDLMARIFLDVIRALYERAALTDGPDLDGVEPSPQLEPVSRNRGGPLRRAGTWP